MRSMGPTSITHDVSVAEATDKTIAQGIEKLYKDATDRAKKQTLAYDQQGILSIEYTQADIERLELQKYFPNGMANGVRIHFIDANAKKTLPVRNMVEGKIRSLCRAANKWTNDSSIAESEIIQKFESEFNSKNRTNISKDEQIQLLEKYIAITLKVLYENKKARFKEMKFDKLASLVMKESTHYRTTERDILIFDESKHTFSYDHVVPGTTTAHDRTVGNPVANLGISFDGSFPPSTDQSEGKFTVTSSIMHHASLAPLQTKDQSELAILIDTCNHIEEIARQHAKLQRLGASDARENGFDIDWCYQLLTTNFGNADDQQKSYMRIAQAASIMDGSIFGEPSGNDPTTTINLNMSLMNAGINPLHLVEYGLDFLDPLKVFEGEKGEQNRKAYLHLSSTLRKINIPNTLNNDSDVNTLLNLLTPKSKLNDIDVKLKKKLIDNTERFNELRRIYNAIQDSYALSEGRNITALLHKYNVVDEIELQIELDKLIGVNRNKKKLENEMQNCIDKSNQLNKQLNEWIKDKEDELIEHWKDNKTNINNSVTNLVNKLKQCKDENEKLYICTLIFKARMDELYYSGEYYHPKNAVLFNAYTAAYQKLTGMSASTGCKSGNDRTYVMRLVLAAIQGHDINTIPLPTNYEDKNAYDQLRDSISIIAMSNSAIYTALNDTGGSPKASPGDYEILEPKTKHIDLANISDTAPFGKYAAHKLKPKDIKSQTKSHHMNADVTKINQDIQAKIQERNSKTQKKDNHSNDSLQQHRTIDDAINPAFIKFQSDQNKSVEDQAKEIWDQKIQPLLDNNKKLHYFMLPTKDRRTNYMPAITICIPL